MGLHACSILTVVDCPRYGLGKLAMSGHPLQPAAPVLDARMVPLVVIIRIKLLPEQVVLTNTEAHEPTVMYPNAGMVTENVFLFEFGENE